MLVRETYCFLWCAMRTVLGRPPSRILKEKRPMNIVKALGLKHRRGRRRNLGSNLDWDEAKENLGSSGREGDGDTAEWAFSHKNIIKSKIAVTVLFYLFYRFLNSATADRRFPIHITYQYTTHTFVLPEPICICFCSGLDSKIPTRPHGHKLKAFEILICLA